MRPPRGAGILLGVVVLGALLFARAQAQDIGSGGGNGAPTGAAAGDLAGTYPSPTITTAALNHNLNLGTGTLTATVISAPGQFIGTWSGQAITALLDATNFTGGFSSVASTPKMRNITCSWSTVGIGGTNGVKIKIRDVTAASDLCTCAAFLGACAVAINTPLSCDCNSAATIAGHLYVLQYAAATDCATNPANSICTVELTQ